MGTSDGFVVGQAKIVDNGPDALRWSLVVLPDGYRESELPTFAADAQKLANTIAATPPFNEMMPAINIHRIDVASTDSGADDPCGTGATARTFFDARFCEAGIQRLLVVETAAAIGVAGELVPGFDMIFVAVNSTTFGGSGGAVAVFSKAFGAMRVAIHEMGHTAFGLADEYEYFAGCASGEANHDFFDGPEPVEPNVTANPDRATIKWAPLINASTPVPTTRNPDCSRCDPRTTSPVATGTVGAFEGARYFHCGSFRPEFNCCMRNIDFPFCRVCREHIKAKLRPFMP